jgi:hypothetical protein
MVKSRLKQVTARISSTSAYQFGLLRIRVLAVALSAIDASPSGTYHLGFLHFRTPSPGAAHTAPGPLFRPHISLRRQPAGSPLALLAFP